MRQQKPRRPQSTQQEQPIKYGDVFAVSGELASKPVAPRDAATMQAAECMVMRKTQKGGPASVMGSAAQKNEKGGVVGHYDASAATVQGVIITERDVGGARVIREAVGGQVVGQYLKPGEPVMTTPVAAPVERHPITIGEALEASALSAGNKPVDGSDAAAIQAAELRATSLTGTVPGGIAASAQSAATLNARTVAEEKKTKLAQVLTDASFKLPSDKVATREDAEGVIGAEVRNNPNMTTYPGGVAASVAMAARLNQK